MKKNEVSTVENFALVTPGEEIITAIAEEMDGLGPLPFDRVKIPSGGITAFEVPGEDENTPDISTELVGIILHHYPVNAFWPDEYNGTNEPPFCSAMDGKNGINRDGVVENCTNCPYNEYGSGKNGAKACKNTHRCYILRENNPVPLLLTLPPTSLNSLRNYLAKQVVLKGLRSYGVITKITLQKEKSNDGILYSRAAFSKVGIVADEQKAGVMKMVDLVKNMTQPDIVVDDYGTEKPVDDFCEVKVKPTSEEIPVEFTEVEDKK